MKLEKPHTPQYPKPLHWREHADKLHASHEEKTWIRNHYNDEESIWGKEWDEMTEQRLILLRHLIRKEMILKLAAADGEFPFITSSLDYPRVEDARKELGFTKHQLDLHITHLSYMNVARIYRGEALKRIFLPEKHPHAFMCLNNGFRRLFLQNETDKIVEYVRDCIEKRQIIRYPMVSPGVNVVEVDITYKAPPTP